VEFPVPAPAVSIIVGAYNCPRYLPIAIDSLLRQSFTHFELLLVDDGSTDRRTPALLKKFARRDPRVRIITAPHAGIVSIRNRGLAEAAAPLIGCMDQDDWAFPTRFAAQVDFLHKHPDVAVVGGWQELMDPAGRPIRVIHTPTDHDAIEACHLSGVTAIGHPTALYRADVARAVGGYSPHSELAEDLHLWLRIAEVAKLANLPQVVLRYRVHAQSTSSLRHERQLAVITAICAAAWQRRGLPPRPLATQSWRPDHSRHSQRNFDLGQGWSAFQSGHRKTALCFAAKSVVRHPLHRPAWKLLACASFKKTPKPPAS
jgi:glycosyltransferase involved in cell wall biosynthesis